MKFFKRNGLAIILVIFSIALSACGDDGKTNPADVDNVGSIKYVMGLTTHGDFKDVADIVCEVTETSGRKTNITMVDGVLNFDKTWVNDGKVIGIKKFRVKLLSTIKKGYAPETKESYNLGAGGSIEVTIKDRKGEDLASRKMAIVWADYKNVSADDLEKALQDIVFEKEYSVIKKSDGSYEIKNTY